MRNTTTCLLQLTAFGHSRYPHAECVKPPKAAIIRFPVRNYHSSDPEVGVLCNSTQSPLQAM